jgi:hypothetical protein
MKKVAGILLLAALFSVPAMAQENSMFKPKLSKSGLVKEKAPRIVRTTNAST